MSLLKQNSLKFLAVFLGSILIPLGSYALRCDALFTQDFSGPRSGLSELNKAQEKTIWRKAVRDGGGADLNYFVRDLFIKRFPKQSEFAEDVVHALTDQSKRFEFLFFLKSNVIQRLARKGNGKELENYSRTKTIPERLLRIVLTEMARNFGFELIEVHRTLSSEEFIEMMRNRVLPVDFAFARDLHGHLFHILQVLQIAFHIDRKYQSQGITARFYQQLSEIEYHMNWDLLFDDLNDRGSSPDVWNPIYQTYLNWEF